MTTKRLHAILLCLCLLLVFGVRSGSAERFLANINNMALQNENTDHNLVKRFDITDYQRAVEKGRLYYCLMAMTSRQADMNGVSQSSKVSVTDLLDSGWETQITAAGDAQLELGDGVLVALDAQGLPTSFDTQWQNDALLQSNSYRAPDGRDIPVTQIIQKIYYLPARH